MMMSDEVTEKAVMHGIRDVVAVNLTVFEQHKHQLLSFDFFNGGSQYKVAVQSAITEAQSPLVAMLEQAAGECDLAKPKGHGVWVGHVDRQQHQFHAWHCKSCGWRGEDTSYPVYGPYYKFCDILTKPAPVDPHCKNIKKCWRAQLRLWQQENKT